MRKLSGMGHQPVSVQANEHYSGRKITESLVNVTVRGEKRWKEREGSAIVNSLNMYSITENIYYSQLSSVAILLQPEPVSRRIIPRKWLRFLSLCAIVFRSPPASHVCTCNGQWSSQLLVFCVRYKSSRCLVFFLKHRLSYEEARRLL
jgi:hypothetical protein